MILLAGSCLGSPKSLPQIHAVVLSPLHLIAEHRVCFVDLGGYFVIATQIRVHLHSDHQLAEAGLDRLLRCVGLYSENYVVVGEVLSHACWMWSPTQLSACAEEFRSEERRVGKECRSRWS